MNFIMIDKLNDQNLPAMEYVRLRILAKFFRGDIFGQAGRVRSKKEKEVVQALGDSIKGVDLEAEEKRRLDAIEM